MKYLGFCLRLVAAIILFQTLFFKFTGAPESIYIFSSLGVEPYGRLLTGILELIAGFLLLTPFTQLYGALMGIGLMLGALISHVFILGIEVQGDGGLLFTLAVIVFISCIFIIYLNQAKLISILKKTKFIKE